jgi:hypothetical protein
MSPDIKELFDVAADDSQRSQIDAHALLATGKRKVRARNAGVAVGSGVVAAAIVVAASQFPHNLADAPVPAKTPTVRIPTTSVPTSTVPSTMPTASQGTPPPTGKPESVAQTSGAELLRKLPYDEAVKRCQIRMQAEYGSTGTPVPATVGNESQKSGMHVTDLLKMRLRDGKEAYCSVPAAARPSYQEPPVEQVGPRGEPRYECGRRVWANLTSWTPAFQRSVDGGLTAAFWSNDRTAVLVCDIDQPGATREKVTAFPDASVYLLYGSADRGRVGSSPSGVLGAAPDGTPIHWLGSTRDGRQFWGGGGLSKDGVVRYAMFAAGRKLTEAKPFYGVYAMRVWLPDGVAEPDRVVGYDAKGKIVEDYQPY